MPSKIIKRILKYLLKPLAPIIVSDKQNIHYWKEKIFVTIGLIIIYGGFIAYAISMYFAIIHNITVIAILDTLTYLLAIFIYTKRNLSFHFRVWLIIFIMYILSLFLLLFLGNNGAGFIWLFGVPFFAAVLLELKSAIRTFLLTILTTVLLYFFIKLNVFPNLELHNFTSSEWLIKSVNFICVCGLILGLVLTIIKSIQHLLDDQRQIMNSLDAERKAAIDLKIKAEESDRLKSAFLANISHEIRTPLNAIMGFSSLINEKKLPDEKKVLFAGIIKDKGNSLLNIIDDILDFAKIEADQVSIQKEKVNLYSFLEKLFETGKINLKNFHKEDMIDFSLKTDLKTLKYINTDPYRLEQILCNLITNAIKYTNHGKIKINCLETETELIFSVDDTGIGIPKEKTHLIWNRFTQLNNIGDIATEGGSGIGLTIAKALTDLLDGRIWHESKTEGSVFFIAFNLNKIKYFD
jgi:signal transduction histidine kinase